MTDGTEPGALGLRERKKQMTRRALLDAAARLFEQRGYDNVTVAQIADAANISVKTMFTYVASKEDLAFDGADQLRDELVIAVEHRGAGVSVTEAVAGVLRRQIAASDGQQVLADLRGYQRGYGESVALQNRLRRMWADFEDALTAATAVSAPRVSPADARLQAMRAVLLVRSTTTAEVRDRIGAAKDPKLALTNWLRHATRLLESTSN